MQRFRQLDQAQSFLYLRDQIVCLTPTSLLPSVSWLLTAAILIQPAVGQNAEYRTDDGSSENILGSSTGGDYLWGQYFQEATFGRNIDFLSIAFGDVGVAVGTPFQIAVYDDLDDDLNPTTGLTLLTSASGTVEFPGPVGIDSFQEIDIPDTEIFSGFFIAVFVGGTGNTSLPAKIDQTYNSNSSWFAEHDMPGGLDISDPFGSATVAGLVGDFGEAGNFLVRAEAFGCLLGDINRDGFVNLLDVAPFIDVIFSGQFQCEADINL